MRLCVTGVCRPLPETELTPTRFLPLTAAVSGKRQLSAVDRHDGKLGTCMEEEQDLVVHLPMLACTYPPRWSDEESSTLASLTEGGNSDMDFC